MTCICSLIYSFCVGELNRSSAKVDPLNSIYIKIEIKGQRLLWEGGFIFLAPFSWLFFWAFSATCAFRFQRLNFTFIFTLVLLYWNLVCIHFFWNASCQTCQWILFILIATFPFIIIKRSSKEGHPLWQTIMTKPLQILKSIYIKTPGFLSTKSLSLNRGKYAVWHFWFELSQILQSKER